MNQLDRPQKGETIAVMHTSLGDISIRLFPDKAPKTVENFVTHAKNGYYDGLKFHRVINDFMIQGGDTNGSQFFIVQAKSVDPRLISQMRNMSDSFPAETVAGYENVGGTPHLDFRHTVFGQVYDGMVVVDAIAAVKTGRNDMPVEDVMISSIDVSVCE